MIQLVARRTQAGFDVAQALAVGQLGKGHRKKLIPAGETTQPAVAIVTLDNAPEIAHRKEAYQLGEDRAALIHEPFSAAVPFKSRQKKTKYKPRYINSLTKMLPS